MTRLNYGPAKKFLFTCQYLKGQEIKIRRGNGAVTTGTVVGFGACGSIRGKIELWAKVKDNRTGEVMQVDLMTLYRALPPGSVANKKGVHKETPRAAINEEAVSENAAAASE